MLGVGDLARRTAAAGDVAHVGVELRLRLRHLVGLALGHALAVEADVAEHADERQQEDEDGPAGLAPARDVVAAEQVREDDDQQVDPHHPREEDDHRPDDVCEWVVRCEHGG